MKNMGGSAGNSIDQILAFLGSKRPPWGVIFRWLNFLNFCVFRDADPEDC